MLEHQCEGKFIWNLFSYFSPCLALFLLLGSFHFHARICLILGHLFLSFRYWKLDGLYELSIFHCLRRELLLNRYYTATMDQTIRKWVEEGNNLFVVAENEEGKVYTQGSPPRG